ncbi:replication initiator protein A [Lactiplantibacillus plantarum]|uniref:replication initiator protein A n=1 Tax=Lactiplantibacillus plantarum TaxID=1590 RepID=UPI003965AC08
MYSVLRDRLSYSLSNNWVDENNNVYFICTNNELKDLRNWSNNKIKGDCKFNSDLQSILELKKSRLILCMLISI